MAHQGWQNLQGVRLDNLLVMLSPEMLGDLARVSQFVKVAFAEADRECFHRRRRQLGHLGHHGAGIHAAAEKCTEWHVGDQTPAE